MASPLAVLPLDLAKEHLNETADDTSVDVELIPMIGAAVERVRRHLGRLPTPGAFTEVLAVKTVLTEYWRTQRTTIAPSTSYGGGASGAAVQADSGPGGRAPLAARLTELLGPPAAAPAVSPVGSFPPAEPWPDAPYPAGRPQW